MYMSCTSFWLKGIKTWHVFVDGASAYCLKAFDDFSPTGFPIMNMLYRIFAVLALVVAYVAAEKHVVSFDNRSVVASVNPKEHH